jgi:ATP-dependent RNA helicase HelY
VRVRVLDDHGRVETLEQDELDHAPTVAGRIELPTPYEPGQRHFQDEAARRLRTSRFKRPQGRPSQPDTPSVGDQRAMLTHHDRIEREIGRLEAAIERRAGSLDEQFDAVMAVLIDTGHVEGWQLTTAGHRVRGLYHERDLLLSLAIGDGLFDGLDGPTLAGLVSCVTYEHRSSEPPPTPWFPSPDARRRFGALERLARDLEAIEDHHGLTPTPAPDPSIFAIVHAWTAGQDLDEFLDLDFLSGGDFVRNAKQLIDVLRQFGHVIERPATARMAREAADALHRGVVAASSALDAEDDDAAPAAS